MDGHGKVAGQNEIPWKKVVGEKIGEGELKTSGGVDRE